MPIPPARRYERTLTFKRDKARGSAVPRLQIYTDDLRAAGLDRHRVLGVRISAGIILVVPPDQATEPEDRRIARHPRWRDLRLSGQWFANLLGKSQRVRIVAHRRAQTLEITPEYFPEENAETA